MKRSPLLGILGVVGVLLTIARLVLRLVRAHMSGLPIASTLAFGAVSLACVALWLWPELRQRGELFIGWRYLYKPTRSRALRIITGVFFLVLLLVHLLAYRQSGSFELVLLLIRPTELVFALVLLLNFFSVFTSISILGIMFGVSALTVTLSVTSGFQGAFKQRVLGVNAHVIVLKYGVDFSEYRDVMKTAAAQPHVLAVAPFTFNDMMIARGTTMSGVLIKGVDPALSPRVLDVNDRLLEGRVSDLARPLAPADDPGGRPLPQIFLGRELQKKLKAKVGDRVRVVSSKDPSQWMTTASSAQVREFRVAGTFYYGFEEYDRRLAVINLKDAQQFFQAGDVVQGVELKIDDIDRARAVAHKLDAALAPIEIEKGQPPPPSPFRTIDWEELNHNLFTALKMQKTVLSIILTVIILVAAFNVVAALTMLVIDKSKEIAILKSMGMRSLRVAGVFQMAGLTIGLIGIAGGLLIGLDLCWGIAHYRYLLDARVYLIDQLPVQISTVELALTAGITLFICFLATLYPALKAAWLDPVEGLRYE